MTLGGLALAVGILVDDATVEIENINRNISQGKEIIQAILDGARRSQFPRFVSTLSHLHRVRADVFPVRRGPLSFRATGRSRRLRDAGFVFAFQNAGADNGAIPVPFADRREAPGTGQNTSRNPFVRLQLRSRRVSSDFVSVIIGVSLGHGAPKTFRGCFFGFCVLSFGLLPFVGQDFFPAVDNGEFKLHMRAPTGTRLEDTADLCDQIENDIRRQIPPSELVGIIDNIGLPYKQHQSLAYELRAGGNR